MSSDNQPPDRLTERAEALVVQAGMFARWATRTGTELARKLPGAAAVESELGQLERTVLGELRRRLDNVDPLARPQDADGAVESLVRAAPPPKQTEPLRAAMAELLTRSMEQGRRRAREYLYLALLRQLLPDEARILAALADGSAYPLIHVDCRTGVTGTRRLLANASTVGRAAGVAVPAFVPRYLTRLLHLDLVEIGEPDPALSVQYDIVLTDDLVRAAEDAARATGRARLVRQTVRISPLGRDLWDACHPHEESDDVWADATVAAPAREQGAREQAAQTQATQEQATQEQATPPPPPVEPAPDRATPPSPAAGSVDGVADLHAHGPTVPWRVPAQPRPPGDPPATTGVNGTGPPAGTA